MICRTFVTSTQVSETERKGYLNLILFYCRFAIKQCTPLNPCLQCANLALIILFHVIVIVRNTLGKNSIVFDIPLDTNSLVFFNKKKLLKKMEM